MTDSTEHPENAPKTVGESAPETGSSADSAGNARKSRRNRKNRGDHKPAETGAAPASEPAGAESPAEVIVVPAEPAAATDKSAEAAWEPVEESKPLNAEKDAAPVAEIAGEAEKVAEDKPAAAEAPKAEDSKPAASAKADRPAKADQPASEPPKMPPPAPQTPAAAEKPGRSAATALILPIAALLIGIGGLGLAGYTFKYTQDRLAAVDEVKGLIASSEQKSESTLQQARVIAAGNDEAIATLKRQIAALPDLSQLGNDRRMLIDLQKTQQKLSTRVDEVLGASRREWKLAEAEHLLRLASLRLSALQDVGSALRLVEAADGILRDQDDPASFNARTEMARALESLRLLKPVDRTGLFLQLAALTEQVGKANTRNPEFQIGDVAALEVDAGELEKWWNNISRYVRIDIAADEEIRPLLMGKTLEHLRLALRLNLEQAQWAVLNGRPQVYLGAIRDARSLLELYFGLDMDANKALYERLGQLETLPVTQEIPDLSAAVNALDAYLVQRAHADVKALEAQQKAKGGAQ